MKKMRFLLVMIFWAALVHGASFASQSGQAKEQTSSPSGEKSATNSSPEGNKDSQARGQKDQTGKSSDENQQRFAAVKKGTPKRRPVAIQTKPVPSRQQHSAKTPVAKGLQTTPPKDLRDSPRISPTLSSSVSGKGTKGPSTPVPPPTAALNGQQFKNSREPGARMAASGGPANSPRGTAAINGSDMKHKP